MTQPPVLQAPPITAQAFAPYGQLIEVGGDHKLINEGLCKRFSNLLDSDIQDGQLGLSFFQSQLRTTPHVVTLMERHPLGSQCFVPMGGSSYLAITAPDDGGKPGKINAWTVAGDQAINIARNTWHGVLAPVSGTGLFAVLDRIGQGANLEEHTLATPVQVIPTD